jgi:hypothetical protein
VLKYKGEWEIMMALYTVIIGKTDYFGTPALLIKEVYSNNQEAYFVIISGEKKRISF